jgi:outer membrane protein insertion porin family
LLAVLLVLAAAVLACAPARAARAVAQVTKIEILGAEHIDPDRLRDLMRTRSRSIWRPFSSAPYRRDIALDDLKRIEAYYRSQGYLDARAKLVAPGQPASTEEVQVVIRVTEGALTTVAAVDFAGNRAVKRDVLVDAVRTRVGAPYAEKRVELDRFKIVELYADRGRPYTIVADSVAFDSLGAYVHFAIQEAPGTRVRAVEVSGNQRTKDYVVERELTLERGDLLRRNRLLESREQLLETGLFRDARVEPALIDSTMPPPLMDLEVSVVERKMGWVLGGVGYNSSNQVRLSGEVGHRNILGNAQRLIGRSRVAFDVDALFDPEIAAVGESAIEVSFIEPRLFTTRTLGSASVFRQTSRLPTVQTTEGPVVTTGTEAATGVALAAERKLGRRGRIRSAFEHRWVDQDYAVAGRDTSRSYNTRSLNFLLERDRRDNPFDPLAGSFQNVFAEVAGGALGGTSDFFKLSLSSSWYRPLGDFVLATRLRGGWIHVFAVPEGVTPQSQVPFEDRFRAGGAVTVRGYPEDSLGPQLIAPGQEDPATLRGLFVLIGNVELRFPLAWRLSGAVFLDGGNVWEEASAMSIANFLPDLNDASIEDVRYSTGGGLRLGTPVGPLRVDYGHTLVRGSPERLVRATSGGEWHLSLGQAF